MMADYTGTGTDELEVFETEPDEVITDDNNGQLVERDENDAQNSAIGNADKPKRVIRNPQPKLNEETLKGSKGLVALEKYFQRVKFKGHVSDDLNVIMKTYEYWSHRLFPKLPFDNCVARLETLGTKKSILTHMKRIRYNLLVEPDNQTLGTESEDDGETRGFEDLQHCSLPQISAGLEPTLTEEQLTRIRENKEKALNLRRQKFNL